MESLLADSVAQPRFAMLLIGSFAGMALVLTIVGLHGTLVYLFTTMRPMSRRVAPIASRIPNSRALDF